MFGCVGGEKETCYGNGVEMRFYVHEDDIYPADHQAPIRHLRVCGVANELEWDCVGYDDGHRVGCHCVYSHLVDCHLAHVHRGGRCSLDPPDRGLGRDQHRYGLL